MSILDVPGISKAQLEARVTGITDEVVEARDMAQAFAIDSLGSVIESHAIVLQAPIDAKDAAITEVSTMVTRLAEKDNPILGAGMIGMDGRWLYDYLKQHEYYLTIEHFGPVDTPSNTRITMQLAINFCAANGILLRAKVRTYTIDVSTVSITIPNDFWCDLGGAKINRQTGNKTPHDMWVNLDMVNGNTNLSIRGVWFDGKAQVDALTNANPAHRFCGLRLVKCQGLLDKVRADATVNGEGQVEGTRGGILLQESVYMECTNLRVENTIGTGLFIDYGRGSLKGLIAKNNTGSGMSGAQNYWTLENLSSEISGYSGISINGPGFRAKGIYATGAPVGFAGVNFGHLGVGIDATDGRAEDVVSENNLGWGINVTGGNNFRGRGFKGKNNGDYNLRVTYSPGCDIEMESVGSRYGVVVRESVGTHRLSLKSRGTEFGGCTVVTAGTEVIFDRDSVIEGAGVGASGIQADAGTKILYKGELRNNAGWGATANGGEIMLDGTRVVGNGTPWRAVRSGVLNTKGVILNEYASTDGTFIILAGTATLPTIPNLNAVNRNRIVITALNTQARTLTLPTVTALVLGVSFAATLSGVTPTDASYSYVIN